MKKLLLLFLIPLLLGVAAAQEKPPVSDSGGMYRLDFVIKEMDGAKVINSRNYSMLIEAPWSITGTAHRTNADLRAGNRVPVSMGKDGFQYMDVGINIGVGLAQRTPTLVTFDMNIEVSSLTQPEGTQPSAGPPVVRSERSTVAGILTPGKELVVSSIDDPVSNRRFVVAVVPTKLM
ncbi:MAG TPA: hypothetical protein VFU76_14020 [Terriglobales bacterium]|nr:hypothetical protein [Terriglobales bacterium]